MHKTLQRYVLNDFAKTFALALVVLTLLFFLGTGLRIVRQFRDLDFALIAQVLPTLVATSLSLTLPLSVLAGCTLTFSRLAHDNEITAIRACGVHLHTIVGPILSFAGLVAAVAFVLGNTVVPDAYFNGQKLASQAIDVVLTSAISDDPQSIDYFPGYCLYCNGIDSESRLRDLVLHRIDAGRGLTEEIMARRGKLEFEHNQAKLTLDEGSIAFIRSNPKPGLGHDELLRPKPLDPSLVPLSALKKGQVPSDWVDYEIRNYDRRTSWASFEHYEIVLTVPMSGGQTRERAKYLRLPDLSDRIQVLTDHIAFARRELEGVREDKLRIERVVDAIQSRDVSVAPSLRDEADRRERALTEAQAAAERARAAPPAADEDPDVRQSMEAGVDAKLRGEQEFVGQLRDMASWVETRDATKLGALREQAERYPPDIDFRLKMIKTRERDVRKLTAEWHKRFGLPLACLIVVLLGAPLGVLVRNANRLVAFGISAVPVFGAYYPLLMVGETMAEQGRLPAWFAMQLPNVVIGAIGLVLMRHLYRQ